MRRTLSAMSLGFLLVSIAFATAAALDTSYVLDIHVDYEQAAFSGVVTVEIENTSSVQLEQLVFRLYPNEYEAFSGSSLEIEDVEARGEALSFSSAEGLLTVTPARPLPENEAITVDIGFSGTAPWLDAEDRTTGTGMIAKTDRALTLLAFYPILALHNGEDWVTTPTAEHGDRPSAEAAAYEIRLTVDDSVTPIVPGVLVSQTHEDGSRCYQYRIQWARDIAIVLVEDYQALEQLVDEIPITVWVPSGNVEEGQQVLGIACDAFDYFEQTVGPYAHESLNIVIIPTSGFAGVEYSGGFFVSREASAKLGEDEYLAYIRTIAHEVAHEWFFSAVGNDTLNDPWLDEALAKFMDVAYVRARVDADTAARILSGYQAARRSYPVSYPTLSLTSGVNAFASSQTYNAFVYQIGAYFIEQLRKKMGDDAFWNALSEYYAEMTGSIATPDDFFRVFTDACQCDMTTLLAAYRISL